MKKIIAALVLSLTSSAVSANDYSNVTSGMLLGIYSQPCYNGMKVTSLIPGYSAVGRLYPGDVIKRAAVESSYGPQVYNIRSQYEMEAAKTAIGPNRDAAIEIHRPGQGLIYVWVQFTPLHGPSAAAAAGAKAYGAQFKTEREKPGARNLFRASGSTNGFPRKSDTPSTFGSRNGAARLFGR